MEEARSVARIGSGRVMPEAGTSSVPTTAQPGARNHPVGTVRGPQWRPVTTQRVHKSNGRRATRRLSISSSCCVWNGLTTPHRRMPGVLYLSLLLASLGQHQVGASAEDSVANAPGRAAPSLAAVAGPSGDRGCFPVRVFSDARSPRSGCVDIPERASPESVGSGPYAETSSTPHRSDVADALSSPELAEPASSSASPVEVDGRATQGARVARVALPTLTQEDDTVVAIPDVNLRAAIGLKLGKPADAPITKGDLASLVEFSAKDSDITSLAGLDHAVNVERLDLPGNSIADIGPLSALSRLWWLDLSRNAISELAPVSEMASLAYLGISANSISDLSPLASLPLRELDASDNTITDISSLVSASIRYLNLSDNPLTEDSVGTHVHMLQRAGASVYLVTEDFAVVDLADPNVRSEVDRQLRVIRTMRMTPSDIAGWSRTRAEMARLLRLAVSGAGVSDLSGLEFATNLEELDLSDNAIADATALTGLTRLAALSLARNALTELAALANLANLWSLDLDSNSISSVAPLEALTALTELDLAHNAISDLGPLAGLTRLRVLDLFGSPISDLTPLANLRYLQRLYLAHGSVSDLSPLSGLTGLTWLGLYNQSIRDLTPLAGLTRLSWLYLSENSISDITALSGLPNLIDLYLSANDVSDIEPLAAIADASRTYQLRELALADNRISDLSALAGATGLQYLDLSGNLIEDVSPLAGLTQPISQLFLARNAISDVTSLTGITVGALDLSDNAISNLAPLADNNPCGFDVFCAWRLDLSDNAISDLTPLAETKQLGTLLLSGNSITDASPISDLRYVSYLDLSANAITDASFLQRLAGFSLYGLKTVLLVNNPLDTLAPANYLRLRAIAVYLDQSDFEDVEIMDVELRSAVRTSLAKRSGDAPILVGEMRALTELSAPNAGVVSLAGLEDAIVLSTVDLSGNEIQDLSPLRNSPLRMVDLSDNAIVDISPLAGALPATLDLSHNSISDISPLAGAMRLTTLNLSHNAVADISPLEESIRLRSLDLSSNNISDISSLAQFVELHTLLLADNTISAIPSSAIEHMSSLKDLDLSRNLISDLAPLADLAPSVTRLDLSGNAIVDLSPLPWDRLGRLAYLDLSENHISEISPLANLNSSQPNPDIGFLDLSNNFIADIGPLAGLTVRYLDLGNNQLADLTALGGVVHPQGGLRLTGNPLTEDQVAELRIPPESSVDGAPTVRFGDDGVTEVYMPDPNLRARVREALDLSPVQPLTTADMALLRRIDLSYAGIRDLTGLEYARDLEIAEFKGNSISDLTPLAGLYLLRGWIPRDSTAAVLDFSHQGISDLSPLAGLSRVSHLRVQGNRISDLTPLASLRRLQTLVVSDNVVADLSPLRALLAPRQREYDNGLWVLDASNNPIEVLPSFEGTFLEVLDLSDTSPPMLEVFAGLNVRRLDLSGNSISDMAPIEQAYIIRHLDLSGNLISEVPPAFGASHQSAIQTLNLAGNAITDLTELVSGGASRIERGQSPGLYNLNVSDNAISDLSPLSSLASGYGTGVLSISGNPASDLSPLTNLRPWRLDIARMGVSDLSPIADMTSLQSLDFSENAVADITPLQHLDLEYLHFADNAVVDLSSLRTLARLERLTLASNNVVDLEPVARLPQLDVLDLSDNAVEELMPLFARTEGRLRVSLSGNPVNDSSMAALRPEELYHHPNATDRSLAIYLGPLDLSVVEEDFADEALRSYLYPQMVGSGRWGSGVGFAGWPTTPFDIAVWSVLFDEHYGRLGNKIGCVQELAGVEKLVNLERIELRGCGIEDLEPLEGLERLRTLKLRQNLIADISALATLPNLETVDLAGNDISDLTALSELQNLRDVDLARNRIADLAPLQHLTDMGTLDLSDNLISDVSGLRNLERARFLSLARNAVSNTIPLAGLTARVLHLGGNRLSRLGPGFSYARDETDLSDNLIEVLPTVTSFPDKLDLSGNRISDLRPLAGLEFSVLDLSNNRVSDLASMKNIRPARGALLGLANNDIVDLTPLLQVEWAYNLRGINLAGNEILDIAPLLKFPNLRYANLARNRISDLSPMESLAKLRELDLSENLVSDVSALSGLTGLLTLDLSGNFIEDVAPLRGMDQLVWLRLQGNPLAAEAIDSLSRRALVSGFTVFRDSPIGRGVVGPRPTTEGTSRHTVPLLVRTSSPQGQGLIRVRNASNARGLIWIEAVDDDGGTVEDVMLTVDADETVEFSTDDLEMGNRAKGLSGSVGSVDQDWRLRLHSELDLTVLSYALTSEGFLTAMHDVVPVDEDGQFVEAVFNPGSNSEQVSYLRLINPSERDAEVGITGVDDEGLSPGSEVGLTVSAGKVRTLAASELEAGGDELRGALGDGAGKWRLSITSSEPIWVMSLLENPTGHLTNLSTAPRAPGTGEHVVWYFPETRDSAGRQGVVRVVNHSDAAGTVRVVAFDEVGREYPTITLSIRAGETKHFNSEDLELGNSEKGLSGGVGAGQGDWRLHLASESKIGVSSYVRTSDGFLTSMDDVVLADGDRHVVATFSPGSDSSNASVLRLVNPGSDGVEVRIIGVDDHGASPGTPVVLEVPAGSVTSYSAAALEAGSGDISGALGDGTGKWRLIVEAASPLAVVSLMESASGHMSNLSTVNTVTGDDHGDSRQTATTVALLPSSRRGELDAAGDRDVFRLVPNVPGRLVVRTTGGIGTAGTLTNADGAILAEDSGGRTDFRLAAHVDAGTHYVEVRAADGQTGEYALVVEFTPDPAVPAAPIGLAVVPGDGEARLSWTTGDGGGSPVVRHEYRTRGLTGRFGAWRAIPDSGSAGANATSYMVADLANGEIAIFQVRAVNAIGVSQSSNEASATPNAVDGSGAFSVQRVITTDALGADWVYATDLDGDGDADVLANSAGGIVWFENLGGAFAAQRIIHPGGAAVHAADLDGDGDADVLAALGSTIAWFENLGGAFAAQRIIVDDALGAEAVHAADLDGDGDADVLSASSRAKKIAWYDNKSNSRGHPPLFWERYITVRADRADSVHAADLDGDGDADVLATSARGIVWFENLGGAFAAQRIIHPGGAAVHAADLDGDGDADVLSGLYRGIAWHENLGGGKFSAQRFITTNALRAYSVHTTDLDGDGDADVLSASGGDDKIAWYENLGDGEFSAQRFITTNAEGASSVYAADLDGDGDADVLSASSDDNTIAWYENMSDHGDDHGNAPAAAALVTAFPSVLHGKLESAGDRDVFRVVTGSGTLWARTHGPTDTFGVLMDADGTVLAQDNNAGAGLNFEIEAKVEDGVHYVEVRGADGTMGFYTLSIEFLANGPVAFSAQRVIAVGAYGVHSVHAGDLDGDGDPDVLSATHAVRGGPGSTIGWHDNLGGGAFSVRQIIGGGGNLHAADLDGDGDADVILAASASSNEYDYEIGWIENLDDGFTARGIIATTARPGYVHAADLDGDGDADVLTAALELVGNGDAEDTIAWYENLGGEFAAQRVIASTDYDGYEGGYSVHAADLDGDGDADVLSTMSGEVAWHENLGGEFAAQRVIATNGSYSVFAADLDADGDADVLGLIGGSYSTNYNDQIVWHENSGGGEFSAQRTIASTSGREYGGHPARAADLDGDGDLDVLHAIFGDKIAWYENLGDDGFSARRVIPTDAYGAYLVDAADLDGDGDMDVLYPSSGGTVAWYENLSNGGDDHGDAQGEATLVTTMPAMLHGVLESAGDRDVFRVATASGRLIARASGPAETHASLFDAYGQMLGESNDFGSDLNFEIEATVAAGAHYIEVTGVALNGTGAYAVSIEFVAQ